MAILLIAYALILAYLEYIYFPKYQIQQVVQVHYQHNEIDMDMNVPDSNNMNSQNVLNELNYEASPNDNDNQTNNININDNFGNINDEKNSNENSNDTDFIAMKQLKIDKLIKKVKIYVIFYYHISVMQNPFCCPYMMNNIYILYR